MSDCHTLQGFFLDLLIQEATLRFCGVECSDESLNVGDRVGIGPPAIERHQHLTVVDGDRLKSGRIECVNHDLNGKVLESFGRCRSHVLSVDDDRISVDR